MALDQSLEATGSRREKSRLQAHDGERAGEYWRIDSTGAKGRVIGPRGVSEDGDTDTGADKFRHCAVSVGGDRVIEPETVARCRSVENPTNIRGRGHGDKRIVTQISQADSRPAGKPVIVAEHDAIMRCAQHIDQ